MVKAPCTRPASNQPAKSICVFTWMNTMDKIWCFFHIRSVVLVAVFSVVPDASASPLLLLSPETSRYEDKRHGRHPSG